MKLTESGLRQIIKKEINGVLNESDTLSDLLSSYKKLSPFGAFKTSVLLLVKIAQQDRKAAQQLVDQINQDPINKVKYKGLAMEPDSDFLNNDELRILKDLFIGNGRQVIDV